MSEHEVYVCAWESTAEGFAVWVKGRRALRAEGPSLDEACAKLRDAIAAAGAPRGVLELDPPPPPLAADERYLRPELYLVSGDHGVELAPQGDAAWRDRLHLEPLCTACGNPRSARSDVPLAIERAPTRVDGVFAQIGSKRGPIVSLFSEAFVALLSAEEHGALDLREVRLRQGRRHFFELVGPAGPKPVAVASRPVRGWRCARCGYATWGQWVEESELATFVAREDLPSPLPALFTIGAAPEVQLCVTGPRWRELVGKPGTRGVATRPLGVVGPEETVRTPALP